MIDILLIIGAILVVLFVLGLIFRFIVGPLLMILLVVGLILLIAWVWQRGLLPF